MKITQIDIKHYSCSGLHGQCEGIRHVKSLPFLSVVQATEGSYDISINDGAVFNTKCNGVFVAPSFAMQTITHHVNPENGYMTAHWVFLDVIINENYSLDDLFDFPTILPAKYQDEVKIIINELNKTDDLSLSLSYLYKLIHILLCISTPKQVKHSQVENIISYVHQNYRQKINYDKFAKDLCISKSSLFRIFKSNFGKTPSEYINEYRIGVSTGLLENSNMSVKEIAYSVGFSDEFYFSKMFKKSAGLSPSEHRKMFHIKHL